MSYLALARKWRPKTFQEIVGQDHVVRALINALDTSRLHHAWLFTGTRGVGKTTLSRILAKSLNCERGITSNPCGTCLACVQIDEGRFVDYLEFDGASNRKVEEISHLLEQAVYAPTVGRFKVYMIDEVHMLTGHAFNAMLKTLEEPPPHVKFILATTDPQKIPVTVLSRCLQFSLKQMTPQAISTYLSQILTSEGVTFEPTALYMIAQAARGSMRDALSITDQAIAFAQGHLTQSAMGQMLGSIDQRYLVRCLDSLYENKAEVIVQMANELSDSGLSYESALNDLAALLTKISLEQRVSVVDDQDPLREDIIRLSKMFTQDQLQLFYTIAIHSRAELLLAPDEYAGFVMALLKMLALMGEVPERPQIMAQKKTLNKIEQSSIPSSLGDPKPCGAKPQSILPEQTSNTQSVSNVQSKEDLSRRDMRSAVSMDKTVPSVDQESVHISEAPQPPLKADIGSQENMDSEVGGVMQSDHQESVYTSKNTDHADETLVMEDSVQDNGVEVAEVMSAVDPVEPLPEYDNIHVPLDFVETPPVEDIPFLLEDDLNAEPVESSGLDLNLITVETWPDISRTLSVTGATQQVVYTSEWVSFSEGVVTLKVPYLGFDKNRFFKQNIQSAISEQCGFSIQVNLLHKKGTYSASLVDETKLKQRQQQAVNDCHQDVFVQTLTNEFGAIIDDHTVTLIE